MKILVADDHELFLKGLELVLQSLNKEIELSFAKNYTEIFDILETDKSFDLILTDLAMPGAKWMDAIAKIHQLVPDTPIIILSAVFDKEIVQKTIEIGVSGYIPKTSSNAVILSAVNLVMSGGVYIPAELLNNKELSNEFDALKQVENQNEAHSEEKAKGLTPRQIDVV